MKLIIVGCQKCLPPGIILSNHTIYDMKKQEQVAAQNSGYRSGGKPRLILVQPVRAEGKKFTENHENLF